jgi:hypothetical protein
MESKRLQKELTPLKNGLYVYLYMHVLCMSALPIISADMCHFASNNLVHDFLLISLEHATLGVEDGEKGVPLHGLPNMKLQPKIASHL